MLTNRTKHTLHCILLFCVLLFYQFATGGIQIGYNESLNFDPWERYGFAGALLLYLLRCFTFLPLPQVLFNLYGLTRFNAFPGKVKLTGSPLLAPFICIRVVTRGDYKELVKNNVSRNMKQCLEAGLENFLIEVVTDKPIGLPQHRRTRELVVPTSYQPKSGALFKSRALQYCLEDGVNILTDNDWIVHLDEETLLTENSIRGILNFVLDGKHHFGQGLITYANEDVVNWITTVADSFRVADDMGKLRAQFTVFHKPFFSWKGSFVVTLASAERQVSFDNGPDGSVAEDCYFAMRALDQGYSFAFIEGEMWEKSPFSVWDFIQQRKRWLQGILLVVHSQAIPWRTKWLLAVSCYSWVTLPLVTCKVVLATMFPLPCPAALNMLCAFIEGMNLYMYIFGVIKSFSVYRFGVLRLILCIIGTLLIIPFTLVIENIAVIWGVLGRKHKFYIVNKEFQSSPVIIA
ncbi:Egg head [Frankliniella occidentalis]|uniref:Beta-1,4-mannosyltransferase egh n=1 Tax=Frankliniella occidentalis TaxID=133901 RepID=A0A9C6WSK0_FRAOC|nr:beta-1,4-mannosyltransferase egh [Frankliniella occidentalis]KAE8750437.1 Egg head [Frankliniella occidentalis]